MEHFWQRTCALASSKEIKSFLLKSKIRKDYPRFTEDLGRPFFNKVAARCSIEQSLSCFRPEIVIAQQDYSAFHWRLWIRASENEATQTERHWFVLTSASLEKKLEITFSDQRHFFHSVVINLSFDLFELYKFSNPPRETHLQLALSGSSHWYVWDI